MGFLLHKFAHFVHDLRLFKALRLFFLTNFPGPTVISCPTSIPDSRVLGKQKLGRSFNFNKHDDVDLTKFSDQTKCRASEARKKLLAQKSNMKSLD